MVSSNETYLVIRKLGDLKETREGKACVYQLQEGDIDISRKKLENVVLCKPFMHKKIHPGVFTTMMPMIWKQEQTIIDHMQIQFVLVQIPKCLNQGMHYGNGTMVL